jgi:transposase
MRPGVWSPPVDPSPAEQAVLKAVRRAKLFVFLREHRHELFDEGFQAELAQAYADSRGLSAQDDALGQFLVPSPPLDD